MGEVQTGSRLVKRCVRGFQALGSLVALFLATSAHAATIDVSSTCSLVEAIEAANSDAPSGGCSAGSGADTIKLPFHSSIVISTVDNTDFDPGIGVSMPAGLPLIESTITIEGNGSTISRPSTAPDFDMFIVSTGDLTLRHTTVSGSTSAVKSYYGTSVSVEKSTLSKNQVGSYEWGSNTSFEDSTIIGNSLAIFSRFGNTDVERSAIVRNGYGVFNTGSFNAINSTISHNDGDGFSQAEGGIRLDYCTVTGNSGYGVRNDGFYVAEISHSIISGNRTGEVLGYTSPYFSSIVADAFNVFGHDGVSGTNFPVGATDIVPSVPLTSVLNQRLALNGGATPNLALVSGSPAIDAIPSFEPCPSTDQRGFPRGSSLCDIGAFEVQ